MYGKHFTRWLWMLVVLALPLMVLGIVAAVAQISVLVRYDSAYFSEAYVARYGMPGAAARALELALQTDDGSLLAELQGLRRPKQFETSATISFVELWESNDWYVTYLYFDELSYQRYLYSFEQVGERWVVVPNDLYYAMRSGRWKEIFLPAAVGWWVLGAIAILVTWLLRSSGRFQAWLAGDLESGQSGE